MFIKRLKNLIELSKYRPSNTSVVGDFGYQTVTELKLDVKPKKKLATIVEDLPDIFGENDKTS